MRSFVTRVVAVLALVSAPLAIAGAAQGTSAPAASHPAATMARSFVTNPSAKTQNSAPYAKPYVLKGGGTAPTYSYKNAIRQSVWVDRPERRPDHGRHHPAEGARPQDACVR